MKIKTENLEKQIKHSSKDSIKKLVESTPMTTFCAEIDNIIKDSKITKSDIIKKTTLDRNYAYQILQGVKTGSKDKVIQLCLALKCDLATTNRLLTLSGNPKLYAKIKRDMLIIYSIENKYTVMDTNELLYTYKFEAL